VEQSFETSLDRISQLEEVFIDIVNYTNTYWVSNEWHFSELNNGFVDVKGINAWMGKSFNLSFGNTI
jgi:hypothetical protein